MKTEAGKKDIQQFKHGDENTHFACPEMMEEYGDKVGCCGCRQHECKKPEEQKTECTQSCHMKHIRHTNHCMLFNQKPEEQKTESCMCWCHDPEHYMRHKVCQHEQCVHCKPVQPSKTIDDILIHGMFRSDKDVKQQLKQVLIDALEKKKKGHTEWCAHEITKNRPNVMECSCGVFDFNDGIDEAIAEIEELLK